MAYQDFRESFISAAKQCIPCGCRKNYVPCWDKECNVLHRSFTWAPVGTDSDIAASSLLSRLRQEKQEWWVEAVNLIDFSHSSHKAWRTINKLSGLDAPSIRAPSRQTPSPRNLWRTGHTRPVIASPPGWSTRSCPTYGRSQHLRVTVSLNPLDRRSFLLPSDAWSHGSLQDWLHLPRVLTPCWVGSQILVLRLPQFLHAPTQNSKDLEKRTDSSDL